MKKTFINIGKVVSFYLCWGILISISFEIWERPKFIGDNNALLRLYWELAPLIMTILITIIFIKILEKRNIIKVNIFKNTNFDTMFGIMAGALWIGLMLLIGFGIGILHIEKRIAVPNLFVWILAIFLNTIMQELLVRGYIFSLLSREYKLPVAISVITAIFTFMHAGAFEAGFLPVVNVVTTSILLSLILVRSNALWAPILMHFIWNSVGRLFGIVYLADDYPSIFQTTISGNKLISGGSAGFEGSIIVLAINCMFIIGVLIYGRFENKKISKWANT